MPSQEGGFVSVPLITILIPTYNRPKRIQELLESFLNFRKEWPQDTWGILISENCNAGESQLQDLILNFESLLPVKIVNPEKHLDTAEENLFFGWQFAKGKYIWILGDDDPINFFEIGDLVLRCQSEQSNVFKYNSTVISSAGEVTGNVVTKCSASEISMPFLEFIQKVGMWHTSAGFSTWVIKHDLLDGIEGLNWIKKFRSPIYSHVTYFVYKLFNENCLFVNSNLVSYRMNEYAEGKDDHWGEYTSRTGMPRYYPWTLGFVEQLLELENLGIINRDFWGAVIGDHFSVPRFLEFNSMVNLALLQLNCLESRESDLSEEEWKKLVNYFATIRPDIYENSKQLQNIWAERLSGHPFETFKKTSINGWDLYGFPNSYFAIPEGNKTLLNRAVELVPPKHRFIVQEQSYEKLLEMVLKLESPDTSKLTTYTNFSFFGQLARAIKVSGIWLPKFIKNYGKKFLR